MSTSRWQRLRAWLRERSLAVRLALLFALILVVYLAPLIFFFVESGHAAVIWRRFGHGTDTDTVFAEGFHVKWPWDKVTHYDIRLRQEEASYDVLSSDGLHMEVVAGVRFRVVERGLGRLHRNVGPDYVKVLILPEIGALLRHEIGRYVPDELYAERRVEIERRLLARLREEMPVALLFEGQAEEALDVENVFILGITLPPTVAQAIDEKVAQKHRMLEYDYRLQKEEKERQRKAIEAQGIRAFQEVVAGGISERYLRWKGIDATLALAQSPNAKVVVIGAGADGLPIILGGFEPAPSAAPGAGSAPRSEPPP
jgi:regulator of protease activity HflC (stomatin/prohibitin superfamily)